VAGGNRQQSVDALSTPWPGARHGKSGHSPEAQRCLSGELAAGRRMLIICPAVLKNTDAIFHAQNSVKRFGC